MGSDARLARWGAKGGGNNRGDYVKDKGGHDRRPSHGYYAAKNRRRPICLALAA